jgi:hydrogenase maturation protein HypF
VGIEHFRRLFDITPQVVAHDLHPEYLSTKYAAGLADVELAGVQHHHAHIASCLADNGERGPVIGVAFDGTGYGTEGTIWGGEFLVADLTGFERAGHLAWLPPMPGGAAAVRQPWRMAASSRRRLPWPVPPGGLAVARRNERRWDNVIAMARRRVNSPVTSSAGTASSMPPPRSSACAISSTTRARRRLSLEQLADPAETGSYQAGIEPGEPLRVSGADLIRAVTEDLAAGTDGGAISARFHNGVAALIEAACLLLRERYGLATVALSGGVFQNLLLLDRTVSRLEAGGFRVLTHSQVPGNDGGISFGQAVVAAARDRAGKLTRPT